MIPKTESSAQASRHPLLWRSAGIPLRSLTNELPSPAVSPLLTPDKHLADSKFGSCGSAPIHNTDFRWPQIVL